MGFSQKARRDESLIYVILWLIIAVIPVFISQDDSGIVWTRVWKEWYRFLPFLFIFLIHNFILFPTLFISKKRKWYYAATILLIIVISFVGIYLGQFLTGPGPGPMMPHPPQSPPPMHMDGPPRSRPLLSLLLDKMLISFLVVGFNAAIKLTFKWQDEEQKNKELEKQKLQAELAFLRNQISPHFFMNTLNNIHSLIDINTESAKESVIKLSKLMRYLLYDSDRSRTKLFKEIEFIKSYVDLMKLRYDSKVSISLGFSDSIPNIDIAPMLFTSIVENAFKHGISYQSKSFIEIYMNSDDQDLYFKIKNSVHKEEDSDAEKGGLGLVNMKKRLDLIYGERYDLKTSTINNSFEINIKIPLDAD